MGATVGEDVPLCGYQWPDGGMYATLKVLALRGWTEAQARRLLPPPQRKTSASTPAAEARTRGLRLCAAYWPMKDVIAAEQAPSWKAAARETADRRAGRAKRAQASIAQGEALLAKVRAREERLAEEAADDEDEAEGAEEDDEAHRG